MSTSNYRKEPLRVLIGVGIEGHQSLLCTETLPSITPPAHEAQLPAQASAPVHHHHTWTTKAHLPAANDVQFALIVPETFLASNQHLLARATLLGSAGDDVGGAAGAVVAVRAADIGVASVVRQDEGGGPKILAAPTLLREVVSLTPVTSVHGVVNGLDVSQKVVTSSAILVPAAVSGGDSAHQHLARLAEVAVQRAHVLSPSQGDVSSPSPVTSQSRTHQQQQSSPPALPDSPASEGMHSGRPGTGSGHSQGHAPPSTSQDQLLQHPHAMLSTGASAGPSTGLGIFRGGSLTHGEPISRVVGMVGSGSSQYSGAGNSASSSSLGPYSLYNVHGQSSPLPTMSPYPGYFSQYPSASPHYAPASLVASSRFPHIESYSAVLASMGSHVQHGGHASPQSQPGARASYLPATMAQYPHRSLSSSSSPGPSSHSPSGPATSFSMRERETLLQQSRERDRDRSSPHSVSAMPTSSPLEDKDIMHSPGLHYSHRGSPGVLLKEVKSDPRDPFQKLPSGKEGSLKHRILTRPPDMPPDPAGYGHMKGRSQSMKGEEELPNKRTKYTTSSLGAASAVSSSPTDPHVFLAPHALGPGPPDSTGHYTTTNSTAPSPTSPATTSPTSSASRLTRTPESGPSPGGAVLPPHLHYPPHFIKGSIIQLANGDLKRVEDLQTEDFVSSAQVSADLKVDSSTVVRIDEHPEQGTATLGFSVGEHRVQVTVEATLEHPFFVFGQGWSSCSSERTLQRYGLDCHKLSVGDVCISLTHKDVSLRAAEIVSQQQQQHQQSQSPDTSPRLMGDCGKVLSLRDHGQDCKGGIAQRDSGQEVGHVQGNGLGASDSSGSSRGAVDLSKTRETSGGSRLLTHARSTESHMTSQPSAGDLSSDSRSPRKRRWSAPESDVEKEKMELEKQNSGSKQNE